MFGEWGRSGRLGLEQGSQENPVVLLCASFAEIAVVRVAIDLLGLKDLRFALPASLA
jgi:hypothetical protein